MKEQTIAKKVLEFNKMLSSANITVPEGFKVVNPFQTNAGIINKITESFYHNFYNDNNKRFMILGSSPARRGTAVTGVPFEDVAHLQEITGVFINGFHINKASSNFLYDVIEKMGGSEKFYSKFYMNFVCPLGVVRITDKGKDVNCNYYENKKLQESLYPFIEETILQQYSFNIDRSICFCIGSGENYNFLERINNQYHLFDKIIPLEHPRFIMQYNSKNKDFYMNKYLQALNLTNSDCELERR